MVSLHNNLDHASHPTKRKCNSRPCVRLYLRPTIDMYNALNNGHASHEETTTIIDPHLLKDPTTFSMVKPTMNATAIE